ncbi:MAG: DUF1289 domain-containing protein [bacterium]|nr:DUF1289 domain-containing protein [bacterium]
MAVLSPCIRICELDTTGTVCTGCGRTRQEIARWSMLDDEGRKAVIERAAGRLETRASARLAGSGPVRDAREPGIAFD